MTGFQYKLSFFLQIPQTIGNNGESWSPPKYQFVMMHIPSHNFFYILLPSQIMVEIECFAHQRGGLEALHFADPQWINNNGNAPRKGLWCLSGLDQQIDRKQGQKWDQTAWILGHITQLEPDLGEKMRSYILDKGYQIKRSAEGITYLKQLDIEIIMSWL